MDCEGDSFYKEGSLRYLWKTFNLLLSELGGYFFAGSYLHLWGFLCEDYHHSCSYLRWWLDIAYQKIASTTILLVDYLQIDEGCVLSTFIVGLKNRHYYCTFTTAYQGLWRSHRMQWFPMEECGHTTLPTKIRGTFPTKAPSMDILRMKKGA